MPDSLDDIFNDDSLGLLNPKEKEAGPKTDAGRMIDAFEEVNAFVEKNGREPGTGSMSEYNLGARLKGFRSDEAKKRMLKPFDRFNLLGHVEMEQLSIEDVLGDDDTGLLNTDADTSIYQFKHTPRNNKRAEAEFVAQRQPMKEDEFIKYEAMFRQVHKELKEGKRKLGTFVNIEKNLEVGNFYLLDGILLFLESADLKKEVQKVKSGDRIRIDGRTNTIFENATRSNMTFRSLGKAIQKEGKSVTALMYTGSNIAQPAADNITEDDMGSGWIYVLKSRSKNAQISAIPNLFKIGFSKTKVEDRIKAAAGEATYLFADVDVVATYHCYQTNTKHLENLLHRFFAEVCLNIDVFDRSGQRYTPREWFCVSLEQIDYAINLMRSGNIVDYKFNAIDGSVSHK